MANTSWNLLYKDGLPSFNRDLLIKDGDNYYVGRFFTAQITEKECVFVFKMKSNPDIEKPKEVFDSKSKIFYCYIDYIL